MKLERLTITNFLRVRDMELILANAKIHLVCGLNEQGKSTVGEAVRFALLGDSPRVRLKKDYKHLVNNEARKGQVSLQFDGVEISRDVSTGKAANETDLTDEMRLSASISLGAQSFVDLEPDERRRLLFALTNIKMDGEALTQGLKKREVADGIIQQLQPLYRQHPDPAYHRCGTELTRLRILWETTTGEKYGSKKGEEWTPPPLAQTDEDFDLESIEADMTMAEATATEAVRTTATVTANLKKRTSTLESRSRLDVIVANLPTLKADLASIAIDLDGGVRKNDQGEDVQKAGLRDEISTARELLEKARNAKRVLTCPACAAAIRLSSTGGNDLELVDPDDLNFTADDERIATLSESIDTSLTAMRGLEEKAGKLQAQVGAAEKATELYQNLDSRLAVLPTLQDLHAAQKAEIEATEARDELVARRERARAHERAVKNHADRLKAATDAHRSYLEWKKASDALAPDGVPGELLVQALGALNDQMRASAALADWMHPTVNSDMEIVRSDGMLYTVCSESAQWRLRAIIADVIASRSGTRLLVLDRMDVLDPPGRGQLLQWALRLAANDAFDTIMIMATLKERPRIPKAIEVHWLVNGDEEAPPAVEGAA